MAGKKSKTPDAFPRVLALRDEDMQPDLPTSFRRWMDAGELPADARLYEHVGRCHDTRREAFRDVESGKLVVPGEEWETISYVSVATGKKTAPKQYMILRNPG